MSTSLDIEIRDALNLRRGDWKAIADRSGVSYSWISKFVNGHIPNPGFETLKRLHVALPELVGTEGAPAPTTDGGTPPQAERAPAEG